MACMAYSSGGGCQYCRDRPFEMGSFSFKSVDPRNGTSGKDDVQVRNRHVVRLVECVFFSFFPPQHVQFNLQCCFSTVCQPKP